MTIKSDRWIKRMAREHEMIEPFTEKQVRQGVISYGLSSYGYDMRVSREFKVFTNVFNTLVDPKNFDQRSFVDIEADHVDIPPNSFALARTVEYFRIPRNVLAICLGKSTYARCFRGNTQVALVDGSSIALEDMARRADQGEFFWGYSIGSNGRIIVTLLENPRYIGTDKLYDILLDNGEHIFCTPDHEFILRNGLITQADDLRPGMSLMPLYRDVFRGYEGVYQPLNGTYTPTHRLADEWSIRHGLYENVPDTHRHHIDHNRRNNNPPNIQRVPAAEHIRYHNSDYYDGPDFNAEEHAQAISEGLLRHRNDPEWLARFLEAQRNRAQAFWRRPEYAREREKVCAQHRLYWSDSVNRQAQRERQIARWNDSALRVARSQMSKEIWSRDDGTRREQQREIMRSISIRREITEERVLRALHEAGSIRGAARLLGCDRTVFRRFPEILSKFRGTAQRNHKVVSMTSISGEHDVYCLTVPEAGNFALEAGVFVSNCGIIINTTPFEPGWEGYVTLEISNTTPLPARIYANEGIGQVLFFESDEQCEVSYADKQGKYQGQQDITLPKL